MESFYYDSGHALGYEVGTLKRTGKRRHTVSDLVMNHSNKDVGIRFTPQPTVKSSGKIFITAMLQWKRTSSRPYLGRTGLMKFE